VRLICQLGDKALLPVHIVSRFVHDVLGHPLLCLPLGVSAKPPAYTDTTLIFTIHWPRQPLRNISTTSPVPQQLSGMSRPHTEQGNDTRRTQPGPV